MTPSTPPTPPPRPSAVDIVVAYLDEHWRILRHYLPATARPCDRGPMRGTGLCTHPEAVDDYFVHSRGGKRLAQSTLPEDFCWMGMQDRGGSEYLFVMWHRFGRRFWFYDQCIRYVGAAPGDPSPERTARALDEALARWEAPGPDVIYSGLWGWYDAPRGRFERDGSASPSLEVWERGRG